MTRKSNEARQHVFLTGEPGCGKTTVVRKTIEALSSQGLRVGGMMSDEIREGQTRTGFSVEDLITHEKGVLADIRSTEGPHVGRYTVNLHDLEMIGVRAIQSSIEDADIIVVDEVGPMELHSERFTQAVGDALHSQKVVLGTVHKRARHPLVVAVKSNTKVAIFDVTPENRDRLPAQILARIAPGK